MESQTFHCFIHLLSYREYQDIILSQCTELADCLQQHLNHICIKSTTERRIRRKGNDCHTLHFPRLDVRRFNRKVGTQEVGQNLVELPFIRQHIFNGMELFAANEIQVLVSTTVIEVGINVPNATVMMIENSERFGLAQLHQLRGRVGRGKAQSYCIMVNCSGEEDAQKRLEILNKSNDGFFIASEDLKLRGPGDLFGVRQSGDLEFRLADIFTDADILKTVSEEVKMLMDQDPLLSSGENRELKKKLDVYLERSYEKLNL